MLRRFSANFAVFSIFLDFLLSAAALWLTVLVRPALSHLPGVQPIPAPPELPALLYAIFPLMWVGVLVLFSIYDGRKNYRATDEFGSLVLGSLLAGVAMAGVLYLSYREVSRALFISFTGIGFGLMAAWRVVMRIVFRLKLNPAAQRRLLIVGGGSLGANLAQAVRQSAYGSLEFTGYLEDAQAAASPADAAPADMSDLTRLGSLPDARRVVLDGKVDDVLIVLPRAANGRLDRVIADLHDVPVRIWLALDYLSLAMHHARIDEFAGVPMLDLRAPALSEYQRIIKRSFDLVLCLLALPVVLPLIGLVALMIKLDDGGPVFYHTPRAGENGRIFRMHEFRTMVVNADQQLGMIAHCDDNGQVIYKHPDDPRVTRVGRFLRRTSMDELPQIFNVLRGEMSMVGPRPEMPWLVEKYDLWQRTRFAVPQGITGWWQVNGRSDKPMHLHTDEDLYYIQHYSLWLDARILLKTAWTVLRGKGAY